MNWLVTVRAEVPLPEVEQLLARIAGGRPQGRPIPLEPGETVLRVDGPPDLPSRLRGDPRVVKVSPDSSFGLY